MDHPEGQHREKLDADRSAAYEVGEEPGIEGEIVGTAPLGLYTYFERLESDEGQPANPTRHNRPGQKSLNQNERSRTTSLALQLQF